MRLAESLRRNIMESRLGGLVNKFKGKGRRTTFFPEEILANYVNACETAGHGNEIMLLTQKWGGMSTVRFTPSFILKLPIKTSLDVGKRVWMNIGLMDDMETIKSGQTITIRTRNEFVTRFIGKNSFQIGLYMGIINVLTNSEVKFLRAEQTKKDSEYVFLIKKSKWKVPAMKETEEYRKLNHIEKKGPTLNYIIKKRIFMLKKDNRLYFRGKLLMPVENTLFHIFGKEGILIDEVPKISYNHFRDIIETDAEKSKKLSVLKTIIQAMGWGSLKISESRKEIKMTLYNPPYGMQGDGENWNFIVYTILGFLWVIDKSFKLTSVSRLYKQLIIKYSAE